MNKSDLDHWRGQMFSATHASNDWGKQVEKILARLIELAHEHPEAGSATDSLHDAPGVSARRGTPTPESQSFGALVKKAGDEVKSWPEWKQRATGVTPTKPRISREVLERCAEVGFNAFATNLPHHWPSVAEREREHWSNMIRAVLEAAGVEVGQ